MGGSHRRWRWALRGLAALILLLAAALVVLTHTAVTKWLILPQLSKASGLDVDADWIHITRKGRVVMDHLRVTIPGVQGEAGQFLNIARVRADVDWLASLSGTPKLTGVELMDPVLIVSQSRDDNSLNIESITVPGSSRPSAQVPPITLSNLSLEIAEHGVAGFRVLKRIPMDGDLTPVADKKGEYDIQLKETMRQAGRTGSPGPGFNLDGTVGAGGIKLNLVNFSLTDWPANTLPPSVREISQKLDVRGQVSSAQFAYTKADGITARMVLQGVALNLPVEAEVQGPTMPSGDLTQPIAPRYMHMSNVDGSIVFAKSSVTAKVGGQIENLPYNVTLKYDGVDENSPFNLDFETQEFPIDKNPELLLYAPPMVKYYLKEVFLRPTGIITTHVNVKRGPPTHVAPGLPQEPGPITVSGSLDFHDGTAAYEGFPYEFEHMSGRFEFDTNSIKIVRIVGVSPTGARLLSHGEIAPLDESSEVTIFVDVTDARIDEAMEAAFGPERSRVLSALFNESKHKALVDAGLIRTPEQEAAESADLARLLQTNAPEDAARITVLRERQQVPVFPFRGTANVNVRIHSPRGVNVPYVTNVDIRLPKIGIVADKFPVPIVGEDVMVEIRNTDGKLTFGSFRGVNGGRADISASFQVPKKSDEDPQVRPVIEIGLTDMPLDPVLIFALPGKDGAIQRILTGLGVQALGSGSVRIAPRPIAEGSKGGDDDLGFDADIDIKAGEARPHAFKSSGTMAVANLAGHFEASERKLFLDVDGTPVIPKEQEDLVGPSEPLSLFRRIGGTLTVHVRGEFPPSVPDEPEAPPSFFVAASCPSLDLTAPVESVVGVFSPKGADAIAKARLEQSPGGLVDLMMSVDSGTNGAPGRTTVNAEFSGIRSFSAQVLGSKLLIPEAKGKASVVVDADSHTRVNFDAVSGRVLFGDQPCGIVSIDGELPLDGPGRDGEPPLDVSLLDARFESPFTRTVLDQRLGADAGSIFDQFNPVGTFDATIFVRRQAPVGGGEPELAVQGRIEPRTLTLNAGNHAEPFTSISGSLEFEPGSGVLRGLTLVAPEWEAKADGGWTIAPDGRFQLRTELSGHGDKLSDDLAAILPQELREIVNDLKLKIDGPFRLADSALDIARGGAGSGGESSTQFSGQLDFSGASMEAGVPITDASGSMLAKFDGGGKSPTFRLDLKAPRFKVSGVTMQDARAVVLNGSAPGQVRIPEASGACHGGRFSLIADLMPTGPDATPAPPKEFRVDVRLAGLRFGTLIRELIDSVKPFVGPPSPIETQADASLAIRESEKDDFSRGLVDGEFTLTGLVSDPATRSGRGTVRISGGRVLNLPVVTAMIEASNLEFPMNSSLDFAQAKFYLEGGLITFEDLSVQSKAIELVGRGTMTFPERELNLRFISHSTRPIPILSDIIQGIRNQLIVTTVTGKLGEQTIGLQAPGPSRIIKDTFGGSESQQAKARADQERRAAAERERDRRNDRGIRPNREEESIPERESVVPDR